MINRTLNVASAATLSSFLGLLTLTTAGVLSGTTARAAEDCRLSPGTEAPAGGHWRYRLEKGSSRKCWYLAGVSSESAAETKTADAPKTAAAEPKAKSAEMQPSVANARAELNAPEPSLNATVWPPLSGTNPSQDTNAANQEQPTVLAQRWPEPNSVRTSDDEFAEKMRVSANTQDAAPEPAAPVAATPAPDDNALSPIRILLVAIIGALALAGILLRAMLSFLAKRRRRKTPRRPIWDDLAIDSEQMPPYIPRAAPTQPSQPAGTPRQRYEYRDDKEAREEIEYLLRRAAQRQQH